MKRGGWLTRGKPLTSKPGGSRFPQRRHPEFRAFVRSHECVLSGRLTKVRLCPYDRVRELDVTLATDTVRQFMTDGWWHVCWGPIDSAHVNETQARGAYDVGEIVPLCRGAHRMLDQVLGPAEFAQVTGLDLRNLAGGYGQAFVERGGTL